MTLNRDDIQKNGLIRDAQPSNYRASSYDLSVGTVVAKVSQGNEEGALKSSTDGFEVPPQGMATVISRETVQLPSTIVGYALVKNDLSNYGVLAINTGIIDPGYEGPIASTLINFSPQTVWIASGRPFLRLTFHEIAEVSPPVPERIAYSRETYLNRTKEQVLAHSSRTFLNIAAQTEAVVDRKILGAKGDVIWLALGIVVLTLLVPVGVDLVLRTVTGSTIQVVDFEWKNQIERRVIALEELGPTAAIEPGPEGGGE